MGDDPTDREAAIRGLRHRLHDEIEISDDGRILEAPDGTRLVNGRLHEPDTWIDRRSRWGNPFKLDDDGGNYGRGESVRLYEGWFLGHVERDKWDPEPLRGKDLGCWCVPWLCHGVVILNHLTRANGPDADQRTLTDGGRTADGHDCLALEKAGLGHLEVVRISRCSRCGAAEGATDGIKGVHRLNGNFCTACVLDMANQSDREPDRREGGDAR